jgi:hypothetical protein
LIRVLALMSAFAGPALAQDAAPSAAVLALRERFEAEILAIEDAYGMNDAGLINAAFDIAERVYGSNWDAVRAEARRSLAALPTIDLGAYAGLEPVRPFAGRKGDEEQFVFMLRGSKGKWASAAMRFWDANTVAGFISGLAPPPSMERESAGLIGLKQGLVPMRAYRGRLEGMDVLAVRNWRSLVVAPYSFSDDGLIMPDLSGVRVYPLRR